MLLVVYIGVLHVLVFGGVGLLSCPKSVPSSVISAADIAGGIMLPQ